MFHVLTRRPNCGLAAKDDASTIRRILEGQLHAVPHSDTYMTPEAIDLVRRRYNFAFPDDTTTTSSELKQGDTVIILGESQSGVFVVE